MSKENGERCPSCGANMETMVDPDRNKHYKPAYQPGAQQCFYCGWDNRVITVTKGQATLNVTSRGRA